MPILEINLQEGRIEKTVDTIVGIDLGTTHSLIAYIKDGQPVCIPGPEGGNTLVPSVVYFQSDALPVVGDAAREMLQFDPTNTIYSVKRLMGKSYKDVANLQNFFGYRIIDDGADDSLVKIRVQDKFFTPVELSALILKELKNRAETALGQSISRAVITVPAYFNDNQRQATRDAGRLAGLDVLRIVNEPTAAALAYGLGRDQSAPDETIAVYDLGGGTFDVSILQLHEGIFDVLSTNGDTFLGGDDFDRLIVDFWIEEFDFDRIKLAEDKKLMQELRLKAEQAKKQLSVEEDFVDVLAGRTIRLSRGRFEKLALPLVTRTLDACRQALQDAGLQPAQIDKVVLVGGSTRVPLVKQAVADFFEKPVFDNLNPDEVVALGAAIQADILAGNQRDLLLLDVTPLSLGIETVGGLMDVIIPRNNKIPSRAGRQYTTSVDGQKNLKIAVYQGERDLVIHNRKLGEFILRNLPPMPAGLPKIDIQFILNADGILTVRAKELRSELEQTIDIKPSYGISEEEMAAMLLDSIAHAQQDLQTRALLEARNEANNLLNAGQKFIEQNREILSPEEIEQTNDLLMALEQATKGTDKDVIHRAVETLNEFTTPLAHRAMDTTIREALRGKNIGD